MLEHYDVPADELVASWMQEDDELLVLTRGERSVVVVFEDAGVLQLATPAELRKNASEEVK